MFVYFLTDFGLQTHDQAVNKSSKIYDLVCHTSIYSLCFLIIISLITNFKIGLEFAIITFLAHTITDYITNRISKIYFEKQDYHNGFVVVGFDQLLHYIQLFLTFQFLCI